MSSSSDMKQMYQPDVKPQQPDYQGNQYADSPPAAFGGSADNNHLDVTYNQDTSEIAEDRPYPDGTTAGMGSWNLGGQQYNEDFGAGGSKSYGVAVSNDMGKSPVVERTSVDVSRADRGTES